MAIIGSHRVSHNIQWTISESCTWITVRCWVYSMNTDFWRIYFYYKLTSNICYYHEYMIILGQWSVKRKWLWAIAAPSSQHSMSHFSVVFVKTKICYGPFNFCMGHLHRITKLYVSNGPWPLPFPITAGRLKK